MASRTSSPLVHPDTEALQLVDVLAALGDPLRLGIVAVLGALQDEEELPCAAFALPTSKSTQSAHFRALREAGVIRQRDQGTRRFNRLRRLDLDHRFPCLLDLALTAGRPYVDTVIKRTEAPFLIPDH